MGCTLGLWMCCGACMGAAALGEVEITVVDAGRNVPIPCRVYAHDPASDTWFFAEAPEGGVAIPYDRAHGSVVERHTTVGAHPFTLRLPVEQECEITIEAGKEYRSIAVPVTAEATRQQVPIPMQRWINMAEEGWYSGESHVHRPIRELPALMLAEDINVAFPLTYWGYESTLAPGLHHDTVAEAPKAELVRVDDTHVYYPLNTEYEIGNIGGKHHVQGAVFVLGHRTLFTETAPPIAPILKRTRSEGALLDMDKPNWPWSMMLPPVLGVDLYELANNHMWRGGFALGGWGEKPPAYMDCERGADGLTERGWIDYTLRNYYALLNCGFDMMPTAGTASGVHPVPFGFGRVYVYLPDGFRYEAWMKGLKEGRSFVTTGPMLFTAMEAAEGGAWRLTARAVSPEPLARLEAVVNGEVRPFAVEERGTTDTFAEELKGELILDGAESAWVAVRCFTKDGPLRYAHSAPLRIDVPGKPVRPRKEEVTFLADRMREQIARNDGVLGEEALDEYRQALAHYEGLMDSAR